MKYWERAFIKHWSSNEIVHFEKRGGYNWHVVSCTYLGGWAFARGFVWQSEDFDLFWTWSPFFESLPGGFWGGVFIISANLARSTSFCTLPWYTGAQQSIWPHFTFSSDFPLEYQQHPSSLSHPAHSLFPCTLQLLSPEEALLARHCARLGIFLWARNKFMAIQYLPEKPLGSSIYPKESSFSGTFPLWNPFNYH